MEKKVIYNDFIVNSVIDIYRKNSIVYQSMVNGEMISDLVRQSIKRKGKNYRYKDKKYLYKLCLEQELDYQRKYLMNDNIQIG